MTDEPELVHAAEPAKPEMRPMKPDEKAMLHQLCTTAQQMFAPWRAMMMEKGAAPNSDSMLAAAMATFAGCIIGEFVGMGTMTTSDVEAALDTLRRNMKVGVGLGQKHVARVADQLLAEDTRQQGTERKQ